jgi:alcohol dehydrogenase
MEHSTAGQPARNQALQAASARERRRTAADLAAGIRQGRIARAAGNLLFHTAGRDFSGKLGGLLDLLAGDFTDDRGYVLDFLVTLAVDLHSYLPHWVLADRLAAGELERAGDRVLRLLEELSGRDQAAARRLHAQLREQAERRLRVEGLDEARAALEAARLAGASLTDFVHNSVAELARSNLLRAALAAEPGEGTELGNDYAAFLKPFLRLGGSFVTTNPVLIKLAWDLDPEHWNRRVDDLIGGRWTREELAGLVAGGEEALAAAVEEISSLVTMAVVEENCRLLRDIYLVSQGRRGMVSLQVNPRNHDDSAGMVAEALRLYAGLETRLQGIPNVVFKLPATAAGRTAAVELTGQGIGVTITVNFSLFQTLGFAEALRESRAPVCYIALMNGRLAGPVHDELAALPGGAEAARWAGVEVARKARRLLYGGRQAGGLGLDPGKVRLLIASLRIYDDWLPDISELWGCPVITFFPNARAAFDRHDREIKADAVYGDTPAAELEILSRSEIFRQAWYLPGDPDFFRPRRVLSLEAEDAEALMDWPPVAATMKQFIQLYEEMGGLIRRRIEKLGQKTKSKEQTMSDFEQARGLLKEFKGDAYLYGEGVLAKLGPRVAAVAKRAALVRDTFPGSDTFVAVIKGSLAAAGVELSAEIRGAGPNCPREDLFRIAEELKAADPEVLVSFGGGSTIDATKAAEVLRTLGGDIEDYFGVGLVTRVLEASGKHLTPHFAIQTVASSGAHLTKYSNITDLSSGQKKLIVDEAIVPAYPVFDYEVTYAAPKSLTSDGALDGIAHSLEVLYSAVGQPFYDKMKVVAGATISLVVSYLPRLVANPEDREAREAMCLATDLGGYAIMIGGTNGGHLTSFSLVDVLSHGRACALMNPYYTVFFAPAIEDALRMVGAIYKRAGFTDEDIESLGGRELGVAVAKAMFALAGKIGFPVRLSEVPGFSEGHIERALTAAKNPQLKMKLQNMPVPLTAEMIDEYMGPILEAARSGDLNLIRNV